MPIEIPGYRIINTLGRGGMATVYLAIQEVFEREVALKVMSKALAEDPNFGQRFFREAKIVSKLVHPNIVTVHDVGIHEGYCYLSMEYIDGRDLKQIVDQLDLGQKIQAIRDIAKALDYSGSKGYVHRDIKPENIMFHSSDGRAVLLDFGIARAAESDTMVTQAGTAIGTPHYMSPEQAKGKVVDSRSDIYSLGVVFFYTIARRVPYDAESAVGIGIKHITEPVPLLPQAYEMLQPIIDKMMAKNVDLRYQTATELIRDLDQIDIGDLEHAVEFAKNSGALDEVTEGRDLITLDHMDISESFEAEDEHLPSLDAYEVDPDAFAKEGVSVLPWFLAGSFVILVVATFAYFKSPEVFQPWFDKGFAVYDNLTEEKPEPTKVPQIAKPKPTALPTPQPKPIPKEEPPLDIESGQEIASGSIQRAEPTASPSSDREDEKLALKQAKDEQLTQLNQQLQELSTEYRRTGSQVAELARVYRTLIARQPENDNLKQDYQKLKDREFRKVLSIAQKKGESKDVDDQVQQLKQYFPDSLKGDFDEIASVAKNRRRVMNYILEAEAYLKQNNLTKPPGRNALDAYEKALSLDKNNVFALTGKRNIAAKIADLATKKLERQQYSSAAESAKKALSIDPNNQDAKSVIAKVDAQKGRQKRIADLLKTADKKMTKGDLFRPNKQGAFYDLQSVLRMDPGNEKAKEGLERLVDALSAKAWQLVGSEKFSEARELMQLSMDEYGSHSRVQSLSQAINEVIAEQASNM